MEEAEPEHEAHVGLRHGAVLEHPVVASRHGGEHIGAKAPRRLVDDLHAVLQDERREMQRRHRRQPKAEVVVHAVGGELLADALEVRQPRDAEVAVAEEHPTARLDGLLDGLRGSRPLALAEGDALQPLAHTAGLGEGDHLADGVAAGRQDEYQWRQLRGVLEGGRDVERRRLDEPRAKLVRYKPGSRSGQPVGPQRSEDAHPLHVTELVPRLGEGRDVRLARVVERLEVAYVGIEELVETIEGLELREVDDVTPSLCRQPCRRRLRVRRVGNICLWPCEKEAALLRVQASHEVHAPESKGGGEQQYVGLKQAAADAPVHRLHQAINEALQAWRLHVAERGAVDRMPGQLLEPLEAELVHRVHHGQIADAEKQQTGPHRVALERLAHIVDLLLHALRLLHGAGDLRARQPRALERIDELAALEDVGIRGH
mmetsp:Transcript_48022/g.138290  ORF Transcript_48022/g.138290 Transcript_48022/m.138290 type:complete len:430 (+) Transcript_48022:589-1878(+)